MEAVYAYYSEHGFVPVDPLIVKKNQKAIVIILDETTESEIKMPPEGDRNKIIDMKVC
jgi:hypothetical protein